MDHLSRLAATPRATAVAIADTHARRAREASERFHVPRSYSDYRELLDQPDVEAVTVAVPNHLHATVALDALKAGKHVLLEPPMAVRARDAQRLADSARKSRRTVMLAQGLRLHRHTVLARALIDRGDLGEMYHARAFWLRRAGIPKIGSWYTQKHLSGGGCLLDLGLHVLDLALHLMKDFEVKSVSAVQHGKLGARGVGELDTARADPAPARLFDVEDFGAALIRMKSGRTVSLEAAWAGFLTDDGREQGVEVLGTHGGVSLFPARLLRGMMDGWEMLQPSAPRAPHAEDCIHHFAACVLEGRKPIVPLDQSLRLQHILEAISTSAASGKDVLV